MRIVLGLVFVLFGLFGWVGQFISAISLDLARKLGLQEKGEGADPLFVLAERNAARWDSLVLWTLPLAGLVMLIHHPSWPWWAILAGGVYLDTGGREAAKWLTLRASGIGVGTEADKKKAIGAYIVITSLGLCSALAGLIALVRR